MKDRLICILLGMTLLLGGCTTLGTIKRGINRVTGAEAAKDKEIAALTADFNQKLAAKTQERDAAIVEVAKTRDSADQLAANAFYAQDLVWRSLPSPLRTDILVHNLGEEGWAALQHRVPTYETMLKINERIAKDLDATKTSLADLQKEHQAVLIDNVKVSDAAKVAADRLADAQKSIADLKTTYSTQLAAKEGEKAKLADDKAALETARADDAAARHAMMLKLSMIAGGLALACVLGVIYSPIGKEGLAIFGAVCGFASVGIWYITGPVVLAAVCVAIVGLVGWGVYRHNASNKTVVALTGYLHEKGQLADADLKAWMTKYVTQKDGTVTTIPDKAVAATVTQALTTANKL